ncbi:hypothetical protein C0J52_24539 [Blattella germanica]|nr:hypothetical protein C0J52_24539 [Blattella germanica]
MEIYFTTITSVELEQEGCFFCDFFKRSNEGALRQELKIENKRRGLCRSNNGFEKKLTNFNRMLVMLLTVLIVFNNNYQMGIELILDNKPICLVVKMERNGNL